MTLRFSKYHGTGNDFIMVDGRTQEIEVLDQQAIHMLCHRRFGIGADGLIILQESKKHDFTMRYFNADGKEGSMCGNGGRCLVAFARSLDLCDSKARFEGIDGIHEASFLPDHTIRLKMKDVDGIEKLEDGYFTDTGSPHLVSFREGLEKINMNAEGKEIRHDERFEGGTNVNFAEPEQAEDHLFVRTFERGVEAETWSCGTGATASAICTHFHRQTDIFSYTIRTLGGILKVDFTNPAPEKYRDIHLTGPAQHVFDGEVSLP